jgi:hypothetical protein
MIIEPSKPRLCHDERFLNLWIKDLPFHLKFKRYSWPCPKKWFNGIPSNLIHPVEIHSHNSREIKSAYFAQLAEFWKYCLWGILESKCLPLKYDERFLNLWIKDWPFHLGTLKDIHRLFQKNGLMVTFDDKSGYDHVKLNPYVNLLRKLTKRKSERKQPPL